jgi:diguanylate cyclase (GGDEF)-like protein
MSNQSQAKTSIKNIVVHDYRRHYSVTASKNACLVQIYGENLGDRNILESMAVTIGRSDESAVQVMDDTTSRLHCRLDRLESGVFLTDLSSTNGTFLNDKQIDRARLKDGDHIRIGRSVFKFIQGDNIEHSFHEEIYRMMTKDYLTGAFKKSYFITELTKEFYRFFRHKRSVSLLMMDIDNFKELNDMHGHLAGDRILAQLGELINREIRLEDLFCRYGGEEFALLLPELELENAIGSAQRLRQVVADHVFKYEQIELHITLSIGVAQASVEMTDPRTLIKEADKLLYEAKENGRNQVMPPPRRH